MKVLAVLVLVGMSFASTPVPAAPLKSIIGFVRSELSGLVVQVKDKRSTDKKPRKKHNYTSSSEIGYIPGHVRTPYGYADCQGWWERRKDGSMQCHGKKVSGW